MKMNDVIKKVELKKGLNKIEFDNFYSIGKIIAEKELKVRYFVGERETKIVRGVVYANKLEIDSPVKQQVSILLGSGYLINRDDEFTNKFSRFNKWSGGDGIYSFNIENGNDSFDQKDKKQTLFVFGDTFYGRCDKQTYRRYEPLLMPNNSMAYYNPKSSEIDFRINRDPNDNSVIAFFNVDKRYDYEGVIPRELVSYDRNKKRFPWMSAYNDENIELKLDLFTIRRVTRILLEPYTSEEHDKLSSRSAKEVKLLISNDDKTYKDLGNYFVGKDIEIEEEFRYLKIIIIKHEKEEQTYGLNKIYLYNNKQQYKDIEITASSIFHKFKANRWLWLQDGVVIGEKLYFLPMIIGPDTTQPEGLQFELVDVVLISVPIKNGEVLYEKSKQKMAPVIADKGIVNYLMGGAIMANTVQSGSLNPDGYIYIYGFKTTYGLRDVIVARVKEDRFEYFDDWKYYDGEKWVSDILESATLFTRCSCEFSVSEIREGENKGKFIGFFTDEVNSRYLGYVIGDSPVGPFSDPIIYYETPEKDIFKSTTYTYNSKAHPHLSDSKNILVSYNTNTYSFDHNMSDCRVYKPRFVRLKEIER